MTSIRHRLSLGLTLVVAVLLVGQGLWLTLTFDQLIEKQLIAHLQEENQTLLANLMVDNNARITLSTSRLNSSYNRPFSGMYFLISSGEQRVYSRSLWDADLDAKALNTGDNQVLYLQGPRQQPLLAVSRGYLKGNLPITITVARDISSMREDKQVFQWLFGAVSVIGVLLLIGLQAWVVHRALSPLRRVQLQLHALADGKIDSIDEDSADELRPLLLELNRLMNGMVVKTRRSRQALGNLAHRLKTQLSLLNQIAEAEQDKKKRQTIYQQTTDIQHIIDRELKRARLSGLALPGRGVDIAALLAQLQETLYLIYRDKHFSINYTVAADVKFNGDREDLLEMLGNLLDNASKWCDSHIDVKVKTAHQGIQIIIEDDGPGCNIEDLSSLTRRGFRADESRPGSGLGLAIVFDVVDSYNGTLEFSHSARWGGLQVSCYLQIL